MPLYDFACSACGQRFEGRCGPEETLPCPGCGAAGTQRLPSGFAGPFTVGLRGQAARRSNATRQAREEQRRERREIRKQQGK